MTKQEIEERVHRAEQLFLDGYNCSQSVVGALADLYDIDTLNALRMAAAFGGGMGRMRLTCGAVTGMFLMAGYENGQTEPGDSAQKMTNYRLVQYLAEQFRAENGSITCSELLAMRAAKNKENTVDASTNPKPAERTEDYYHQRPCLVQIASAVRIYCRTYNTLHNA